MTFSNTLVSSAPTRSKRTNLQGNLSKISNLLFTQKFNCNFSQKNDETQLHKDFQSSLIRKFYKKCLSVCGKQLAHDRKVVGSKTTVNQIGVMTMTPLIRLISSSELRKVVGSNPTYNQMGLLPKKSFGYHHLQNLSKVIGSNPTDNQMGLVSMTSLGQYHLKKLSGLDLNPAKILNGSDVIEIHG